MNAMTDPVLYQTAPTNANISSNDLIERGEAYEALLTRLARTATSKLRL